MAVTRPLKEGSVTTYQQKVALGFPDILASEMDADLDTIYAAWNGNVGTANLVDGSVTYAKLAPDAQMWRDTGTTLTLGTSFVTRPVVVQSGMLAVQGTSGAVKSRLYTNAANANTYFSNNFDVSVPSQDDATRPSWLVQLGSTGADLFQVRRGAPGSTATPTLLTLDATGNLTIAPGADGLPATVLSVGSGANVGGVFKCRGQRGTAAAPTPTLANDYLGAVVGWGCFQNGANFSEQTTLRLMAAENWTAAARGTYAQITTTPTGSSSVTSYFTFDGAGSLTLSGPTGTKSAGTTWANPSDPRLKDGVTPYARGLAELRKLEPIEYRLKADPARPCYGFDAAKVRAVFPECVSEIRMKLDPADDEETDGVLLFDMHPILVALVNAVNELAAR